MYSHLILHSCEELVFLSLKARKIRNYRNKGYGELQKGPWVYPQWLDITGLLSQKAML